MRTFTNAKLNPRLTIKCLFLLNADSSTKINYKKYKVQKAMSTQVQKLIDYLQKLNIT